MLFEQVTIVGVGLIGGSVGLAVRARKLAGRVVGVGRDARTLARAAELGAIDSFTTDFGEGVRGAGLVVFCTPVDRIAEGILQAAPHCKPGTLFTDGGSTKGNIIAAVAGKLPAALEYVPAHPLAGSEKTGAENGRADLFANRVTLITPMPGNSRAAVERVSRFWQALGARVIEMDPADHDRALAVTSHLPHAVASGVAGVTPRDRLTLTAGGFRDVTRIAAGDPHLWAAIFAANRDAVLAALAAFADRMAEFRRLLEAGDGAALADWLAVGKQVRDALGS